MASPILPNIFKSKHLLSVNSIYNQTFCDVRLSPLQKFLIFPPKMSKDFFYIQSGGDRLSPIFFSFSLLTFSFFSSDSLISKKEFIRGGLNDT